MFGVHIEIEELEEVKFKEVKQLHSAEGPIEEVETPEKTKLEHIKVTVEARFDDEDKTLQGVSVGAVFFLRFSIEDFKDCAVENIFVGAIYSWKSFITKDGEIRFFGDLVASGAIAPSALQHAWSCIMSVALDEFAERYSVPRHDYDIRDLREEGEDRLFTIVNHEGDDIKFIGRVLGQKKWPDGSMFSIYAAGCDLEDAYILQKIDSQGHAQALTTTCQDNLHDFFGYGIKGKTFLRSLGVTTTRLVSEYVCRYEKCPEENPFLDGYVESGFGMKLNSEFLKKIAAVSQPIEQIAQMARNDDNVL